MDRYDERIAELEQEVLRSAALMRAQVPGDANAQHWQLRATEASDELRALQDSVEQRRALDAAVADAAAAVEGAYERLDYGDGVLPRVAVVAGAVGAGVALLGSVWSRWWVWPLAVCLFAVAGTAVAVMGWRRGSGLAAVVAAQEELQARDAERQEELEVLELERALLLDDPGALRHPVPVEAAVVEGELVLGPAGVDQVGEHVGQQRLHRHPSVSGLDIGEPERIIGQRDFEGDVHAADDATGRQG